MVLHLRIRPDQVLQYDYGYDINGEVYENRGRTRPHDLGQYDTVNVKYSRDGYPSLNFINVEATKGQGDGNEHKFTWRIPEGSFYFNGNFNFYAELRAPGLLRTTTPTRLLIRETTTGEGRV